MRISISFKWQDMWVGIFPAKGTKYEGAIYITIVPMFPIEIRWREVPKLQSAEALRLATPDIQRAERERLLRNNDIDIPDCVFRSKEAHDSGFTKRSFLEAGWRKVALTGGEK